VNYLVPRALFHKWIEGRFEREYGKLYILHRNSQGSNFAHATKQSMTILHFINDHVDAKHLMIGKTSKQQ
jgi:hypothetical protein